MLDNIRSAIIPSTKYKDYAKLNNDELLSLYLNADSVLEKETIKMALITSTPNQKLLSSIIKKNNYNQDYYDDLINAGREGLIHALETYDKDREASFDTYLYLRAKYYMLELINNFSDFRMSHGVKTKIRRLKEVLGNSKDNEEEIILEFSKREGISVDKVKEYLLTISLGNIVSLSNDSNEIDNLKSNAKNPEELLIKKINDETLYNEIDKLLNQREREIIFYRYGLKGYPKLKLEEISKIYNISIHRVSVIVKGAQKKLNSSSLKDIYL